MADSFACEFFHEMPVDFAQSLPTIRQSPRNPWENPHAGRPTVGRASRAARPHGRRFGDGFFHDHWVVAGFRAGHDAGIHYRTDTRGFGGRVLPLGEDVEVTRK